MKTYIGAVIGVVVLLAVLFMAASEVVPVALEAIDDAVGTGGPLEDATGAGLWALAGSVLVVAIGAGAVIGTLRALGIMD